MVEGILDRFKVHILAAFTIIALLALAWQGYQAYYIAFRYQQTTGKVLEASVEPTKQFVDEGPAVIVYRPVVAYEYSVEGKRYVNQRYSFNKEGIEEQSARQIISLYQKDQSLNVFYDPRDPQQAVLINEVPRNMRNILIALSLSEAFSLIALVYFVRKRSRDARLHNRQG